MKIGKVAAGVKTKDRQCYLVASKHNMKGIISFTCHI